MRHGVAVLWGTVLRFLFTQWRLVSRQEQVTYILREGSQYSSVQVPSVSKNSVLCTGFPEKLVNWIACKEFRTQSRHPCLLKAGTCKPSLELFSYAHISGPQKWPQIFVFQGQGWGLSTRVEGACPPHLGMTWSWGTDTLQGAGSFVLSLLTVLLEPGMHAVFLSDHKSCTGLLPLRAILICLWLWLHSCYIDPVAQPDHLMK